MRTLAAPRNLRNRSASVPLRYVPLEDFEELNCQAKQCLAMTMITLFGFTMMLILSLNQEVEASCSYDGCSIPFDLPFFYKMHFTPACNKHDICYRCGDRFGWSRQQCDLAFKRDMEKVCHDQSPRVLMTIFCFIIAVYYFGAVSAFGEPHYQSVSPVNSWCSSCLNETAVTQVA